MKIVIKIISAAGPLIAKDTAMFFQEQLNVSPQRSVDPALTRGVCGEALTIVCTVIQGVAAALYICETIMARKRTADWLAAIRKHTVDGDTVVLTSDGKIVINLLTASPDEVLGALHADRKQSSPDMDSAS